MAEETGWTQPDVGWKRLLGGWDALNASQEKQVTAEYERLITHYNLI